MVIANSPGTEDMAVRRVREGVSLWKISGRMRQINPACAPRTRSGLRQREAHHNLGTLSDLYNDALQSLTCLPYTKEEHPFHETASAEEWNKALLEWVESNRGLPQVPEASFSREADYEDRF